MRTLSLQGAVWIGRKLQFLFSGRRYSTTVAAATGLHWSSWGAFWKRHAGLCRVAKQEVEANSLECWRTCGHRLALDVLAATRVRASRPLRATILVEDSMGVGGDVVAIFGTRWGGSGVAVERAVRGGKERWVLALFGFDGVVAENDRGHGFLLQTEEGTRGESAGDTGEVGVCSCYSPQ